ncbi:hypothetical protein ACRAWG_31795 [Methylobacterium sp. P31]
MPDAPILLGLWLAKSDQHNRVTRGAERATEADGRVGSLREAVETVLAAAQEGSDAAEPGADQERAPKDGDGSSRKPERVEA